MWTNLGEKSGDCIAFDRPNVYGKSGCCLFPGGSAVSVKGGKDKVCFVLQSPGEVRAKGIGHFGEVWRVPSFFSTVELSTAEDGPQAKAVMDLCLPWSHCSFRIYSCRGEPLYALHARMMQSLSDPLLSIWAYEVRNGTGDYLGRTSELQSGYHPIEIYDAHNRNVVTLATVWTSWSAMFSGTWYINNQFPGEPIEKNPMSDARLVTLIAAHQFASQGWFGPFWSVVILVLLLCALYLGIRRCSASDSSMSKLLLGAKEESSSEEEQAGCLGSPPPKREVPMVDPVEYPKQWQSAC